jgi:hypothetical protein
MRLTAYFTVLFFCATTVAYTQEPPAAGEGRGARPAATISTITKGLKKQEGFFTFYTDEKAGKLYLEIDSFGKEFLYFSALSKGVGNGGPERGRASSSIAVFKNEGGKILLIEPVYNYRALSQGEDVKNAVENAFAKSVIWGFTPAATEGDKVLIDLTPFLLRDCLNIGGSIAGGGGRGSGGAAAGGGYRIDPTRSVIETAHTKNFPLNTEFEAVLTFTGAGGGGRGGSIAPDPGSITINTHQSFVQLPDNNFKQRRFDARSGFGQFSYYDFSAPMSEPLVKRFIRRHRLEKKNPAAAVSEPVKPIIYYIDRGAPEPVKSALIEGGSWWNEAFEAAGFKNAFQVKELPADADPMDMRYNVVNWINRSGYPERNFSFGASYIDPRTGEILKGVVTLGSDRHRQDYLIAVGLLQPFTDGKPVSKAMEEMAIARIRQLSAHEIGHTLGFNHNFAASPKDRGSVMDYPYPRFTLKADGTVDISNAYAKGIGSWDKRAVIWGYSQFASGKNEEAELEKIMQTTLKEGFVYIPDIGGNAHSTSHQWDDGSDPIAQLENIMKVRRKVLDNFSEKAIAQGEPMATLEEVLVPAYLLHRYQIEAVAKSIGGLFFTHAVKNDGQITTKIVDPETQWKAFDALMNTITPEALILPEQLIQKIPPRPSGYPASVETFKGYTGPTFDPMAAAEAAAGTTLSYLLSDERAARLIEYKMRDPKQPGFIAVVDKLLAQTWKAPLSNDGYKSSLQVLVNNLTLKYLLQLAANTGTSAIVRGQALLEIQELKEWIGKAMPAATSAMKANMLFALSQIDAFHKDPDQFKPLPEAAMPPGAPIGMPDMDFIPDAPGF